MAKFIIGFILGAITTVVVGVGAMVYYNYDVVSQKEIRGSIDRTTMTAVVQEWRKDNNLRQYETNDILCDLAKKRLPEVSVDWSHAGFYKYENKIKYIDLGENLAKEIGREHDVLSSWLGSPKHKANLVADFKYMCIETDGFYVVQEFGNF